MAAVKFSDLPLEILEQIAERLSVDRLSLDAFSLTNQNCRAASVPVAFRSICFTLSALVTLGREVEHLANTLDAVDAFRHVRQFSISGHIPDKPSGEVQNIDGFLKPGQGGHHPWVMAKLPDKHVYNRDYIPYWRLPGAAYDDNASWEPLANFLGKMPGLRDLTYECPSQFPPCLLECLHTKLPECRLHIRTFRLHSLASPTLDAHELQLANSPALTSIWTRYDLIYDTGYDDFNDQAAMAMVAGFAPQLREVRLHYVESNVGEEHLNRLGNLKRRGEWHGFPGCAPNSQGKLQRLDLVRGPRYGYGINDSCLQRWSAATDFTVLRTFRLEDPECSAIRYLAEMCAAGMLPNLRTFILLYPNDPDYARDTQDKDALASLLSSLSPLHAFELEGELTVKAYHTLLRTHGTSLRSLKLRPSYLYEWPPYDAARAKELCDACPNLEELHISIKRSMGNDDEAEVYKTIGSLPRLQNIQLRLDCAITSVWTRVPMQQARAHGYEPAVAPSDPSFDDLDNQVFRPLQHRDGGSRQHLPRNGHLKQVLINAAVDAQLAFTIWITMLAHRPQNVPNVRPLEELTLILDRVGEFATMVPSLEKYFEHIGRSWVVKRSIRDDEPLCALVEAYHPTWHDYSQEMPLPYYLSPIFGRLWPGAFGKGADWRFSWHSFPLAGAGQGQLWPQMKPSKERINGPGKYNAIF